MKFSLYIAKRYLFTKSSNNAINIITIIAGIGVVVGSAALFVVLSGFAGLKDFSLQFSSYVDPDVKVLASKGKSFFLETTNLDEISRLEEIASFSRIVEDRVLMNSENKNAIITLKGVDTSFKQNTIDSILTFGSWLEPKSNQIVAGWGVSSELGFSVLDFGRMLNIYVPKPGKGQVTSVENAYNSVRAVNTGIFQINETLDNSLVYANIEMAQHLLGYSENEITALEITLHDSEAFEDVKAKLESILGDRVIIKSKFQLNDALYKMLNTEYLAVYLIFTLILIIALFNVVGSIIMMILDKRKNLNTLFNLGVTVKSIRKIFFLQGSLMSVLGGVIGIVLGSLLVIVQRSFGLLMITPTLPYPVSFKTINFLIVAVTIFILGTLASKLASVRITKKLLGANG